MLNRTHLPALTWIRNSIFTSDVTRVTRREGAASTSLSHSHTVRAGEQVALACLLEASFPLASVTHLPPPVLAMCTVGPCSRTETGLITRTLLRTADKQYPNHWEETHSPGCLVYHTAVWTAKPTGTPSSCTHTSVILLFILFILLLKGCVI